MEVLWRKEKRRCFSVRNVVTNHRNGWGSARHADNGILLWRRQFLPRLEKVGQQEIFIRQRLEPVSLSQVEITAEERLHTGIRELDRVLEAGLWEVL